MTNDEQASRSTSGLVSGASGAPVVLYSGHMLDHPSRGAPRFPPRLEAAVRDALRARLVTLRPQEAYGSAACGSDLLVLELVRELGGETHVVLPFPPAEFRAVSVDFASGDWAQRFERALAAAASVTITGRHDPGDGASTFEHANRVFTDIARRRAQALRVPLRALAVLDSSAGGAAGGTAAIAALWRSQGLPYEQVDVAQLRLACAGSASALGVAGRSQRPP